MNKEDYEYYEDVPENYLEVLAEVRKQIAKELRDSQEDD